MSKPFRFGSAISLAALASMIAGCAAPQATGFGGRADGEIGLATRAMAALSANDVPTAISFAEKAVEKTPDDAGFRGLLGNAYFAGGRFWSAEQAYKDALSIYSNQPQVILKLALVEVALGNNDQAVSFLHAGQRSSIPPIMALHGARRPHRRCARGAQGRRSRQGRRRPGSPEPRLDPRFVGGLGQRPDRRGSGRPGEPARRPAPSVDATGQAGQGFGPGRRAGRRHPGAARPGPADPAGVGQARYAPCPGRSGASRR